MDLKTSLIAAVFLAGAALTNATSHAQTQTYPNRQIRIVVPLPPGGNVDLIARTIGQKLTDSMRQQVFIENRGGAGTTIGTDFVVRSEPDGYTLLLVSAGNLTTNPGLYKKLPYDTIHDLAPISLIARVPLVLVVHPSLPVKSVQELIAYAKNKPGEINVANGSTGSAGHLALELFAITSQTKYVSIPYKGSAPALADTVGGHMMMMIDPLSTSLAHIQSGRLRALAVTGTERSPLLPNVPTIAEAALPGYEASVYINLLAPAATPKNIISKLSAEVMRITQDPTNRQKFAEQSIELISSTPEEAAAFIRTDIEKWSKVIKKAGIQPE